MQKRKLSLADYSRNHPSGQIGYKTLCVEEVMVQGEALPLCTAEDRLVDRLVTLSNGRCGCLLVTKQEGDALSLEGIFTDGDLRRGLEREGGAVLEKPMKEVMTPSARIIEKGVRLQEVIYAMEADRDHPVTVLPVIDQGALVGLVRMHDVLQA